MTDRLRALLRHIQPEDIGLVVILILTPFMRPITDILPVFGGENDFLGGVVAFLAAVGAIAALATRVPQSSRLEQRRASWPIPARATWRGRFASRCSTCRC